MSNPQSTHSKLSFSGRKRWKICPISVHLSTGMPDRSSPAAAEGTIAHTIAEFYVCQSFGLEHRDFGIIGPDDAPPDMVPPEGLDLKGKTVSEWNEQLRYHGAAYCSYIWSLIPEGAEHTVLVELKVSIPSIHSELYGTTDCAIWIPALGLIISVDYKYGFEPVDVGTYEETNEQLAAYLVALQEAIVATGQRATAGVLAVYQPRSVAGQVEQDLAVDGAWFVRERVKLATEVARVDNPGAPTPGAHCRYCKGKPKCTAMHNTLTTALAVYAGERSVIDMSDDEVVQLFAARTGFKALWEDIEERVSTLARAGHANLRVEEKQGRRMWYDTKATVQTLLALGRFDLLEPCNLSDALKVVPESFLDGLVVRSRPSRSIKVVDAPPPPAIAAMFQKYVKKE